MEWVVHEVGEGVIVEHAVVGFAEANCYIVACARSREGSVIDPGTMSPDETSGIADEVERLGLRIHSIVNTHGHPDHMSGNDFLKVAVGGEVMIHELDGFKLTDPQRNASRMFGFDVRVKPADRLLSDGDVIEIGDVRLLVLHTPGHSAGHIALLGGGFVLSGDTLFAGSIGRTDLPCSSGENTIPYDVLLESIDEKLLTLPDDTIVLPGHGPPTTIGVERRANPFLR
jgi:glyoxylase-like metal-dependent hydrolase (beta-lactamase superfamily II)